MAAALDTEVVTAAAHVYRDTSRDIYSGLQAHFNRPAISDICLVRPDGRLIRAHQVILAACSRKFATVLAYGDVTGKELPIQGVDSAALESVISFFYRGECLLTPATVVAIYDVCLKLEVVGLAAGCEQYLQLNLNPQTCPVFLGAAVQLLMEPTIKLCLEFAKSRFDDVVTAPAFQSLSSEAVRPLLMHCRASAGELGLARALARWAVRRPAHLPECEAMFKELNITTTVLLQLLQSPDFVAGLQQQQQQHVPQRSAAEREVLAATAAATAAGTAAAGAGSISGGGVVAGTAARGDFYGAELDLVSSAAMLPYRGSAAPLSRLGAAEDAPPPGGGRGRKPQHLLLPLPGGMGAAAAAAVLAAGQRSPGNSSADGSGGGGGGASGRRNEGPNASAAKASGGDKDRDSSGGRPPVSSVSRGEHRAAAGSLEAGGRRDHPAADVSHAAAGVVGVGHSRAAQQQQPGSEPGYLLKPLLLPPPLPLARKPSREASAAGVGGLGGDTIVDRKGGGTPHMRLLEPPPAAVLTATWAVANRLPVRPVVYDDGADADDRQQPFPRELRPVGGAGPAAADDDADAASPVSGGNSTGGDEDMFAVPLSALEQTGLELQLLPTGALAVSGGLLGSRRLPLQVVAAGPGPKAPLLALLPRPLLRQLQVGPRTAAPAMQQQQRQVGHGQEVLSQGSGGDQQQHSQQQPLQQQQQQKHDNPVHMPQPPPAAPTRQQQQQPTQHLVRAPLPQPHGGGAGVGLRLPRWTGAAPEDSSASDGGADHALTREADGDALDLRLLHGLARGGPSMGGHGQGGGGGGGGSRQPAFSAGFPSPGRAAASTLTGLAAVGGGDTLTALALATAARQQQQERGGVGGSGSAVGGLGVLSAAAAAAAADEGLSRAAGAAAPPRGDWGAAAAGGDGWAMLSLPQRYGSAEGVSPAPPAAWPSAGGSGGPGAAVAAAAAAAAAQLAIARTGSRPVGTQLFRDDDLPAGGGGGIGAGIAGSGGSKRRRVSPDEDDPEHVEEGSGGSGSVRPAAPAAGTGAGGAGGGRGTRSGYGGRSGGDGAPGSGGPGNKPPLTCHVDDCHVDLTSLKEYHQRFRICDFHLKAETVMRDGTPQRFCQQCGRFHLLTAFDGTKRSCRARLQRHNARRRKRPDQKGSGGDGGSDEPRKPGRSPSNVANAGARQGDAAPAEQPPPQQQRQYAPLHVAAFGHAAMAVGLSAFARGGSSSGIPAALPSLEGGEWAPAQLQPPQPQQQHPASPPREYLSSPSSWQMAPQTQAQGLSPDGDATRRPWHPAAAAAFGPNHGAALADFSQDPAGSGALGVEQGGARVKNEQDLDVGLKVEELPRFSELQGRRPDPLLGEEPASPRAVVGRTRSLGLVGGRPDEAGGGVRAGAGPGGVELARDGGSGAAPPGMTAAAAEQYSEAAGQQQRQLLPPLPPSPPQALAAPPPPPEMATAAAAASGSRNGSCGSGAGKETRTQSRSVSEGSHRATGGAQQPDVLFARTSE